jgi:hypothetical protein
MLDSRVHLITVECIMNAGRVQQCQEIWNEGCGSLHSVCSGILQGTTPHSLIPFYVIVNSALSRFMMLIIFTIFESANYLNCCDVALIQPIDDVFRIFESTKYSICCDVTLIQPIDGVSRNGIHFNLNGYLKLQFSVSYILLSIIKVLFYGKPWCIHYTIVKILCIVLRISGILFRFLLPTDTLSVVAASITKTSITQT